MVAFIAIGVHNWQRTAQGQRRGSWRPASSSSRREERVAGMDSREAASSSSSRADMDSGEGWGVEEPDLHQSPAVRVVCHYSHQNSTLKVLLRHKQRHSWTGTHGSP